MERLTRRGITWKELEQLQAQLVDQVALDPRQTYLLVSEPKPTFTYGRSGDPGELLWEAPAERGVAVHAVERGGRWTYHGPGQVVIYPIAFLPQLGYPKRAARRFLADLTASVGFYLQSLGLCSEVRHDPLGVYLPQGKIASFGVSLRNGICSHGLAFYQRPQREFFQGIVPCGMPNPSYTSLEEVGIDLPWESIADGLSGYIKRGFQASKN